MKKIKSLDELKKLSKAFQSKMYLREKSDGLDKMVLIKVSMATCGIASGAKEIMNQFIDELDHRAIDAVVSQTGCMGYCYAEPTIEVTLSSEEPVVFGHVDSLKVVEIVEQYIMQGQLVDGLIPVNYVSLSKNKQE